MVVLCRGRGAKWHKWLKELFEKNKVEVRELAPLEHDKLMAYVQVLSHFTELALAEALKNSGIKINDFLKYHSPAYRLKLDMMGRILNQDPNLYAQIQIQNPKSLKVMKEFLESAGKWTEIVKEKDVKKFEKKFQKVSEYLGNYKRLAMEESDWLIEQLNRRKSLEELSLKKSKPDKSYNLVTLGPENTFSSLAAKRYMPKGKIWHAESISEVFDLVEKGALKKGIVPIENKLTGTVVETSDNLFESNLKIQEEFNLPVHLFLVALDKISKNKIKTIYSHSQPARQCKNYLKKHFPKATVLTMPSSGTALKKLISDHRYDAAVICSEEAGKAFQMAVLDKNIEDFKANTTRFIVIGKKELPIKSNKKYKTYIAFYFSADKPGTLYKVLGEFAAEKVIMTKIESQANPNVLGGYVFYIDFEGSAKEPKVKRMLTNIRREVAQLKVLGSYFQAYLR